MKNKLQIFILAALWLSLSGSQQSQNSAQAQITIAQLDLQELMQRRKELSVDYVKAQRCKLELKHAVAVTDERILMLASKNQDEFIKKELEIASGRKKIYEENLSAAEKKFKELRDKMMYLQELIDEKYLFIRGK